VVFYTQGSRAILTCTLDGSDEDSSYLLAWYYNHVPRPSEGRSLVFESIDLSNGGWYTCTTSLENRRYQLDFLVVVGGAPKISNLSIPFSYRVQMGTRVEFPCILPGTPWPRVEWFSVVGDDMTPIDDAGRFRISPVSQSLVIFNTTEDDLKRNYSCLISNRFDEKMLTYTASITGALPPPSEPDIPYEADQLVATTNTSRADICCVKTGTAREGDRFKWFRNGVQLSDGTNSALTVRRNDDMGSGFYCCEIYSNTSTINNVIVFNTHCVTLVFQIPFQFVEPSLMDGATYHLPRGVKAGVICRGTTKGSSPSPPFYDPPELTWTGPNTTGPPNNFTGLELAYSVIDIEPASSGVYQCYGQHSVSDMNTTVSFDYIDRHIDETTSGFLIDNLADEGWRANGSANITVVMNERVFLLPFSTNDTIGDTWLSQDFTLTDNYSSFTISGRVRLSNSTVRVFPVIQVYGQDGGQLAGLEHPEKGSLAWQWVQKNLSHNGTATYTIKLALESGAGNLSKRQVATDGEMAAFFDDINVDAQLSTPPPTETEGDETMFIIIVASSCGGGLLAIILAVLLIVFCYFCCCRKGKDSARPMRKITTLVKKKAQRYRLPSTMRSDQTNSPAPKEYEIPVLSATYATLKGHVNESGDTKNHGEYTTIDPQSLDEPSYYSTTFKGKPSPDEGGVHTYLEVRPPIPTHRASSPGSSRGNSPIRPSGLATLTQAKEDNVESPDVDVLEGDSIEMYDYVNADLGPA
jgi:hypothetical protein